MIKIYILFITLFIFIANLHSQIQFKSEQAMDISSGTLINWSVAFEIKADEFSFIRTIGGDTNATEAFDLGLDSPAPPPGMTYYAYLATIHFPFNLEKDIRLWKSPYTDTIKWELKLLNAFDKITKISWDSLSIPLTGNFYIMQGNDTLNMRKKSTYQCTGDKIIKVRYQFLPLTNTIEHSKYYNLSEFSLDQNYPNPFNPSTFIEFQLSHHEFVELAIFDISGRKVCELAKIDLAAGKYKIQWTGKDFDGVDVAGGIYFCKLISKNQQMTRKMILLR